jgi:cellulose synthase (UDP-forming)
MNKRLLVLAIFSCLILILLYLIIRIFLFFIGDYLWYEKTLAFLLLLAECFILIHTTGYLFNILQVIKHPLQSSQVTQAEQMHDIEVYPPVAIVVASYKEPLILLEDTLTCFYNLSYPNKQIYFLDDTRYDKQWDTPENVSAYRHSINQLCKKFEVNLFRRRWRGAKAGMINDLLNYLEGNILSGFEMTTYGPPRSNPKPKYILVFDADMNPFPDMVEPLVRVMELDPTLSFVQTPQFYSNFEKNRVAKASGLQQSIFYEYICEGKSLKNAMFCCGTNVIIRLEALKDVGGFEETSVTEDFATSLQFHLKNWKTAYINKVCAFGLGPEDLGSYFKQQFRWASGTLGLFRVILIKFFKNPFKLKVSIWWEYFLSGTHYLIGWVFFIMVICPVFYLFGNVPSFFAKPEIYFIFFTPYIISSFALFLWTLHVRKYRFNELLTCLLLNAVSFPIYIRASIAGLIGIKGTFHTTPKIGTGALPLFSLWPQLLTALFTFAGAIWGVQRLIFEGEPAVSLTINVFWAFVNFLMISSILYFNNPEEE